MSVFRNNTLLFNQLYNNYNKLSYSVAYKYTQNLEICEDCVQETFLTVWQKIDMFSELNPEHSKNLICTISRGVVFDKLRHQDTINKYAPTIYELSEKRNENIDVSVTIASEDIKKAMKECLNEREQDMLVLKFYHGLSNNEIAEMYHIKKAWTSQLISGALLKIKKYLGDEYNIE